MLVRICTILRKTRKGKRWILGREYYHRDKIIRWMINDMVY